MADTTNEDKQNKLVDLLKGSKFGMLTTMDVAGKHVSRPMGMQQIDFHGDMWFFTYRDTSKVAQIAANPEVNVAVSKGDSTWVSLSGTAEVVEDRHKAEELWNPAMKAWFPDGLDTPNMALIKVTGESAEYWDSPSSKVVTMVSLAKAVATGKTASDIGENEEVTL